MKLLNKTNLPAVIVNAIEKLTYAPNPDASRISVTSLISPPIIFQLRRRHWHEIEEDASESAWRIMGTAIHKVIESVSDDKMSELKVEKQFGNITISGVIDVAGEAELYDYKITSAWKKVFSVNLVPDEWSRQLNCYAYLKGGINTAKVIVIFRDWSRSKSFQDADYPQNALMAYDVPLATQEDQKSYIEERVKLHKEAMNLPDDALTICSPEERWQTETTYAVYKNENKTATRVLSSQPEAEKIASNLRLASPKDKYRIEVRQGQDKRCEQFCSVKQWCPYGKTLKGETK